MSNCSLEYINSAIFPRKFSASIRPISKIENIEERQKAFAKFIAEFSEPYVKNLIKDELDIFVAKLQDIVNSSFQNGLFDTVPMYSYATGNTNISMVRETEPSNFHKNFDYLRTMYGENETLRNYADKLNSRNLSNYTLVNMQDHYEIYNDRDLNESLIRYQEYLFNTIKTYLLDRVKVTGMEKQLLESIDVFKNFNDIDPLIAKYLPKNNVGIYFDRRSDANNKAYIEAFIAYVTLNNFDNYLIDKRGSYIKITNPKYRGVLTNDMHKYHLEGFGARLSEGWENDKDKDKKTLMDTTSLRLRHVVESFKYYKRGSDIYDENKSFDLNSLFYIVQKINTLLYNPGTKNIIINDELLNAPISDLNKKPISSLFTNYEKSVMMDRSLYDLIANKERNIFKYWSIVIKLLNTNSILNSSKLNSSFGVDERNLLYTLYKNIFEDDGESLKESSNRNPSKFTNYYTYVMKAMNDVGNSIFVQSYMGENGDLHNRNLKDSLNKNTKSLKERDINSFNSKINPIRFQTLSDIYSPSFESDIFTFNYKDYTFNYNIQKRSLEIKQGDITYTNTMYFNAAVWEDLKDFVGDLLKLNFKDPGYNTVFNSEYSIENVIQYKELHELTTMAASVFFNLYFSNTKLNSISNIKEAKNIIKQYYGKSMAYNLYVYAVGNRNMTVKAVTRADVPQLKKLASIINTYEGKYNTGIYKDGSGNPIASIVTTRLADKVLQQYETIRKNPLNPAYGFSLMNNTNLFGGIAYLRDFTDGYEAKNVTKFNTKEFFDNAFLINYLGEKIRSDKNNKAIYKLFPDAISDKPQVLSLLIHGDASINIGGKNKVVNNLNTAEIKQLAAKELGEFYAKSLANILSDFYLLRNWLGNSEEFNPLDNFSEFNAKYGNEAINKFNSYVLAYNTEFPQEPLKFTDQIHFFNNGGKLAFGRGLLAEIKKHGVSKDTLIKIFKESAKNTLDYNDLMYLSMLDSKKQVEELDKMTLDLVNTWIDGTLKLLNNYDNNETFWKKQEARLLLDLMRINYKLDAVDNKSVDKDQKIFNYLRNSKIWYNSNNGRVVLGIIKHADGTINTITSTYDFKNLTYVKEINGVPTEINYKDSEFDLTEYLKLNNATLELHPDIANFNALNYFAGQEYILSTVGTFYNHDGKKSVNDLDFYKEEAFRVAAARKRAVSQTANTKTFAKNLINGTANEYSIAVMKDPKIQVSNIMGNEDMVKYLDGCTLVSPETVYLENNSLGPDAVGVDKKTFVHFYDNKTGTGGIIKTACFAITNARIRNSADVKYLQDGEAKYMQILKIVAKLMMQRQWYDHQNILQSFMGGNIAYNSDFEEDVKYEKIFFQGYDGYNDTDVVDSNDKTYKRSDISENKLYTVSNITKSVLNDCYEFTIQEVNEKGEVIGDKPIKRIKKINSNYTFWQAFGGENSLELNNNNVLIPSEVSIRNLVTACINVGSLKPGKSKWYSSEDVIQPLKDSSIQYLVTEGAIKQGGGNFNNTDVINNPNNELNTFNINIDNAGIQLNAEHKADGSVLSLMTQVLNTLSSRNYMTGKADEVYTAMEEFISYAIEDFTDEIGKTLNRNDKKFKDSLVTLIIDSLKNQPAREANLLASLAEDLIRNYRKGTVIDSDKIEGNLALSLPSVYAKLITILSSAFTKKGIKLKFKGLLAVLNPSVNFYKIYGGKMRSEFRSYQQILDEQANVYDNKIVKLNEIRLGRRYKVISKETNLVTEYLDLTDSNGILSAPRRYWKFKESKANSDDYFLVEDITQGNNLASYDFNFDGISDNVTNHYHMLDLAIIRALYNYKEEAFFLEKALKENPLDANHRNKLQEYCNKYGLKMPEHVTKFSRKYLERELQRQLFGVGTGEFDTAKVIVVENGVEYLKEVKIKNTKVNPYEIIMPMIYASKFGLEVNDNVSDIVNDINYFVKKILSKWETISDNNFDVALKNINGSHTYLIDTRFGSIGNLKQIENFSFIKRDDKVFRTDEDNNILYELSSEHDKIYEAEDGSEIIATDNINFYINSNNFNTIKISNRVLDNVDNFKNIYNTLTHTNDKTVNKYLNMLERVYADKIEKLDDSVQTMNNKTIKPSAEELIDIVREINSVKLNADSIINGNDSYSAYLVRLGREIHTSFLQSLKVLAARIPAQSMQSFMAMKVVGFDKSNLNSAYVNHMQFWLQGSDLDIDKVSLLGYSFGKDGKFLGWSEYFNLENEEALEASLNLPLPTGKEAQISIVKALSKNDEDLINDILKLNSDFLKTWYDGVSAEKFEDFARIVRYINKNGIKVTEDLYRTLIESKGLQVINKHNKFLKNNFFKGDIVKNFISSNMFKISNDPVSSIQSQSPIDEPVTILKDKGNSSKTEKYDTLDIFGNYMTAVKGFRKNQISKDCVGITASGMKIIEGFIHYFGKTLLNNHNHVFNLLANVNVCGSTYKLITNAYTPEKVKAKYRELASKSSKELASKIYEILDALDNIDQESDGLLVISAILGAAVDNAKDPILGKINGGSSMLPLYIYGVAMGIPFEVLSNCMMSDTARALTELMEGNLIQDIRENNFQRAYSYIENGPTFLAQDVKSTLYSYFTGDSGDANFNYGEGLFEYIKSKSEKEILAAYDKFPEKTMKLNRAIEELIQWKEIYTVAKTEMAKGENGDFYVFESLKTLYQGSQEMAKARPVYNLNKQLDTDINKIIKFIDNFNTIFSDRYALMSTDEKQTEKEYVYNNYVFKVTPKEIMNEFKEEPFSFDRFVDDESYRELMIAKYNVFKHSVNILDAFYGSPQYKGFLQLVSTHMECIRSSAKFRFSEKYSSKVFKENKYKSYKRLDGFKKINTFFDIVATNKWLRNNKNVLNIPEKFVNTRSDSNEDITILLGTTKGNIGFKNWMESEVIPNLQKGRINGRLEYALITNSFINCLKETELDKTEDGNTRYAIVPSINTMPKTSTDMDTYQKVKNDFSKLFTNAVPSYKGYSLGELFFFYNLINFNFQPGQNTYTNLFEDIISYGNFDAAKDFISFNYNVDETDLVENVDFTFDDLLKFTAPRERLSKATGKYVYFKNYNTQQWELYAKKTKISQEGEEIEDLEDVFGGDENFGYDEDSSNDLLDIMGEDGIETTTTNKNETNDNYVMVNKSYSITPWGTLNSSKYLDFDPDEPVVIAKGDFYNAIIENNKIIKITVNNISYSGNKLLSLFKNKGISNEIVLAIRTNNLGTKQAISLEDLDILVKSLFKNCK